MPRQSSHLLFLAFALMVSLLPLLVQAALPKELPASPAKFLTGACLTRSEDLWITADAGYYVTDMLDNNSGTCEAWARFLIAFTRIHGVNAKLVRLPSLKYIHRHNGAESYISISDAAQLLMHNDPSRVGDELLVPVAIHVNKNGQANPYEAGHLEEYFADGDHAIVNINGRYYDPIYEHPSGASYNTINEYADNSIDHFMYLVHRCDIAGRWIPDVFETRCNFDEIDEFFEQPPL